MPRKTMIILIVIFTVLIAGLVWYQFHDQTGKVQSKAFDVVLQELLDNNTQQITVEELEKNYDKYLKLDSRQKEEFDVSHLQGAIFIGFNKKEIDRNLLDKFPKDTPVVVYCSVGYRSEITTKQLLKAGFKNVSNLYGGIFEWTNRNKPLVDTLNQHTNKIHGYNMLWSKWLNKGNKVY